MLLVLVVGWAAWLAVDALRARAALVEAATLVDLLEEQVRSGDRPASEETLAVLQDRASTAQRATHGPHWWLAGFLPLVGEDVRAVQTVSEVVDGLAQRALPGLMDASALVDPAQLAPSGGRIDLGPLQDVAPVVVAADAEVQRAAQRLADLPTADLVQQLRDPVRALDSQVQRVAETTATAARAVRLLPAMLGAEGPRRYLLLMQNNAEPRATGGLVGNVALVEADDGAVRIVEQRSGGSLGDLPAPVLPLSDAEQALFGDDLAADMRDVSFTPDFPRSAEIARALWAQQVGGQVDGVLSVDPGTLALVLGATGPLALEPGPVADAIGGRLTEQNAVQALLNTVYLVEENPEAQDAFFASTASAVLSAAMTGAGGEEGTVDALAEAARQGRLMVWSADEAEQALLSGTVLSGELRGTLGDSPVIGVYVNEGTASKMAYYLRMEVDSGPVECLADGRRSLTVSVTLSSTAPADAASLPPYIAGAELDVPPGTMQENLLLYAPDGGRVEDVRITGSDGGVFAQQHDGLSVVGRTVVLAPGAETTVEYDMTVPGGPAPVLIRHTPLVNAILHPPADVACG